MDKVLKILLYSLLSTLFFSLVLLAAYLNIRYMNTGLLNSAFALGYCAIFGIGGVVGMVGSFQVGWRKNIAKSLFMFGLSLFVFAATVICRVIISFYNIDANPSILTYGFVYLFYPFLITGAFFFLKSTLGKISTSLIVVTALSILVGIAGFYLGTEYYFPEISDVQYTLYILYHVGDWILIALGLWIIIATLENGFWLGNLVSVGFFLQAAADIVYFYRLTAGTLWNGDIADVLYSSSAYFLSLAVCVVYFTATRSINNGE